MVTDWLRRKQKAHDNKKSMEAYELRKQLALSMKWDLVRKKRAELQEKHQTLVDLIARVTEFMHLTLRHLSVKKFSTNVRAEKVKTDFIAEEQTTIEAVTKHDNLIKNVGFLRKGFD